MNKFLPFLVGCFVIKQTCGFFLIARDTRTEKIYSCHTTTLECKQISFVDLMVVRETTSCGVQQFVNPITGEQCQ